MTRRVLVLSYYFPPLGLSGVQRTSKFVKYLPEFGWKPHVVTAEPRTYFAFDDSLLADIPDGVPVDRTKSLDPTRWTPRKGVVGIPSKGTHGIVRAISNRIFIPDNKVLWIPYARRAASKALESYTFHAIFSTAPPFSSHQLAIELGHKYHLPVVLDFRDNWVGNPRKVFASDRQKERHVKLEREALTRASKVTTINRYIAADLQNRSGVPAGKIHVIEQGYDPADFDTMTTREKSESTIDFVYSGIFYDAQKPDAFLQGFAEARKNDQRVRKMAKAVFVGLVPDYFSTMVSDLGLNDAVQYTGYLDHDASLDALRECQIPWLTIGRQEGEEQISTGKLAEYIGSEKPILGLVPPGAAADLLNEYKRSIVADPDDASAITRAIIMMVHNFAYADKLPPANQDVVQRLDRRRLTGDLADLLDGCVGG